MARVPPLSDAQVGPDARGILDRHLQTHGRVTNMKRTLAHSPVALKALMGWFDLHREIVACLGERATTVFVHAISAQTDCLICSTFFRRWLIEAGEDADALVLDEREQTLAEYGQQLARAANEISDDLFARLQRFLNPSQIVTLTALGGLMIATNILNNALRIDLDEYLVPFRKRPG